MNNVLTNDNFFNFFEFLFIENEKLKRFCHHI